MCHLVPLRQVGSGLGDLVRGCPMTCYHPMIRVEDRSKRIRAKDGHYYNKAHIISPENFELESIANTAYTKREQIPCGKCIGCRLEYAKEWATRGFLESLEWQNNYFVTLTYDDDNIHMYDYVEDEEGYTWTNNGEWGGTLVPKELQDFIKRLRIYMDRNYKNKDIRYMACGEYGGETQRPHYHLILFNLNLPLDSFYAPKIINKNMYYQNTIIEKMWKFGFSNVCPSNWNTMNYVARYITKKVNGSQADKHYAELGQEKEFFRVSLKPGIGENYFHKHWKEIYKNDKVYIINRAGSVAVKPPKYFDELLKREQPEAWKKIQERRKHQGQNSAAVKDMQTSLSRSERLLIEERSQDEKTQRLIRSYEAAQ